MWSSASRSPSRRCASRCPAPTARRSTSAADRRRRTAGSAHRAGDGRGVPRQRAVAIDAAREGVGLAGHVSIPSYSRANALQQYAYVNGRPVRDRLIAGAIRGAFADVLPRDRHAVDRAVPDARSGHGRRQRASGQGRCPLPRSRPGARPDRRRDPRGAGRRRHPRGDDGRGGDDGRLPPRPDRLRPSRPGQRPPRLQPGVPRRLGGGFDFARSPSRPLDSSGFGEAAQAGFDAGPLDSARRARRRRIADDDAALARARRGARAGARELHRRADRRFAGHRRPARRA